MNRSINAWAQPYRRKFKRSPPLASVCNCFTFWDPDFRIEFRRDCPIDDHKIRAAQAEVAA